jgi:phosphatidylserine/phosphatidylglycerophosphate/cardiolipin synthase-like enzyme
MWHEAAVFVEGNIVTNLEHDFVRRWNNAATGNQLTRPQCVSTYSGRHCQIVKTDPWQDTRGTLDAYRQAITSARHYIYIENQYVNYQPLGEMLYEALAANQNLQLIMVIPFITEESAGLSTTHFEPVYWFQFWRGWTDSDEIHERMYLHGDYLQAQIINRLRSLPNAANQVGVFALAGCVRGSSTAEEIYPHSKVAIVDDTWAIIGSANTNGRGFELDGEMNAVIHHRGTVSRFRTALWREHLGVNLPLRQVREFLAQWNGRALSPARADPTDCTCAELRNVQAVKYPTPRPGQRYNGGLSWVVNVDPYI